ncbi:hypothetical protein, partial [Klebsiella pneumoniae]|uniref:hypothetical protein n=1 Tax=Klebsiella pneumoniae TaxID=573 RepID=UPI0025521854
LEHRVKDLSQRLTVSILAGKGFQDRLDRTSALCLLLFLFQDMKCNGQLRVLSMCRIRSTISGDERPKRGFGVRAIKDRVCDMLASHGGRGDALGSWFVHWVPP